MDRADQSKQFMAAPQTFVDAPSDADSSGPAQKSEFLLKQPNMVRLLIVADVRLYREGMEASFAGRPNFHVVGSASTGDEAIEQMVQRQPEAAIIDMATRDSLDIVRRMAVRNRELLIVGFGVDEVVDEIVACAEAGLAGYIPSDASFDDLIKRVETICQGELLCSARVTAGLFRRLAGEGPATAPKEAPVDLTPRELQVLGLIEQGQSNKLIARTLGIEVSTVKNHVHNLLEKLDVATRAQAARLGGRRAARKRGQVPRFRGGSMSAAPRCGTPIGGPRDGGG